MELMVVIAIIGILSAVAIPNAISWRNNAQVNSAARALYSDLQNAKSTAVKENRNCTVLFDTDGESYTIFVENPFTASLEFSSDDGDRHLKTVSFSEYGAVSLQEVTFPDNNDGNPAITFRPTGFPHDVQGGLAGGHVTLTGATGRRVILTAAGNVSIEEY